MRKIFEYLGVFYAGMSTDMLFNVNPGYEAVGGIVLMIVWAMFGSLILGEGDER
jgi:uncharacterized BrkB/YihY/UPF0761 family membrane protein